MMRRMQRISTTLAAAFAIAAVSGCATMQPLPPGTRPPTSGSAGPAAGGTRGTTHVPAGIDTVPSRDAAVVLGSIPEPLAASERVTAPAQPPPTAGEPAAPAITDTTSAPADSGASDVPIPSPTVPMGERPRPPVTDSVAAPVTAPAVAPATPAPDTSRSAPAPRAEESATPGSSVADTCWRVQIAAPADRAKAERYRSAAQSLLLVPVAIEVEKGLSKVRTRDCMDRAAADALKRRALESGFAGAFRFTSRRP